MNFLEAIEKVKCGHKVTYPELKDVNFYICKDAKNNICIEDELGFAFPSEKLNVSEVLRDDWELFEDENGHSSGDGGNAGCQEM